MGLRTAIRRRLRPTAGPVARTRAGELAGLRVDDMHHFLGVPYAQPPVGDLRWRAPQPLVPWTGVRPAVRSGPAALQQGVGLEEFLSSMLRGVGLGRAKAAAATALVAKLPVAQSEDCLTLDIRAPAGGSDMPVLVWIHGGDHVDGSKHDPIYQSDALPERGCVLVTVGYRLGLLGWFTHPDLDAESATGTAGNYGMRDQIAALQWVRDNIAAFGGDPGNVTIFGESAGGDSVLNLMTSPEAAGLFHRAIAQSPSTSAKWLHLDRPVLGFRAARDASAEFADRIVGPAAGQLARLRALDADALYDAYREHSDLARHFYPVVDGALLPETPMECFAALRQAAVPLLIGANADEGSLLSSMMHPAGPEFAPPADGELGEAEVIARLEESYGDSAGRLLELYPGLERGDAEAQERFVGDHLFWVYVDHMARQHAAAGHPVFRYRFEAVSPLPDQTAGAFHAAELVHVFGSSIPLMPVADDAHLLTREMGDRWYAFAAAGDPAFPGRAQWPAYDPSDPVQMVFDHPVSAPRPCPADPGVDVMRARIAHVAELVAKPST